MNRFILFLFIVLTSCNTGNLKVIMDLPIDLNEVSGIALDKKNKVFWMVNDSGNKSILYGLNFNGKITKTFKITAKNRDWEDLTMDGKGNLYIGNFGNNDNDSKGLSIIKVKAENLALNTKKITPEIINFSYPEQKKFPPKKSKRHFDCESFFFFKDSLYLFTKSRNPKEKGKTYMYQLPVTPGQYEAKFLDTFTTCKEDGCWVTSADINNTNDKIALLSEDHVYVFSNYESNQFFRGNVTHYTFTYKSQKESVSFKNDSTLYIADEYLGVNGGNLYEFTLN